MTASRRLAAILAADVVGYSRLMAGDEEGTLTQIKLLRSEIVEPQVAAFQGRIFKAMGDGFLAEFPSVVNAVSCAIAIQEAMIVKPVGGDTEEPLQCRMGINLGDVLVEGDDLFGDGVNVAARLEALAPPGGIVVTANVKENLGTKLLCDFIDRGKVALKNIPLPVQVYQIERQQKTSSVVKSMQLSERPSIAVLPFTNMGGDPEQEYFADGMVEDIITELSRNKWLLVIARNSTFVYKGRPIDIKQVGRDLGVRYVMEGSVRKAGSRLRITGQLIDASTGSHLWAERFEGELANIFELQDRITSSVVGAIQPKLEQAEIERAQRKPTENLDAYDFYLRGMAAFHLWEKDPCELALASFTKAIALDPRFAAAYGMAARCYSQRKTCGWVTDRIAETAEAERLARRAAELAGEDGTALAPAAMALAYVVGDLEGAAKMNDMALKSNPNLALVWLTDGWIKVWQGQSSAALESLDRALRLSPQDPHKFNMEAAIAAAHCFAGRYQEALNWTELTIQERSNFAISCAVGVVAAAFLDQQEKSSKLLSRLQALVPSLRISTLRDVFPIKQAGDFAMWEAGMRKAGLPE